MRTSTVMADRLQACPSKRLDPAHYPGDRRCLCDSLAREERLAEIAELLRRNESMTRKVAENTATINTLRAGL